MTDDSVTQGMLDALAKARPSVRFLSSLALIFLAVILAGGVAIVVTTIFQVIEGRPSAPSLFVAPAIYIVFSLLFIAPVLSLYRYGKALHAVATSPEKEASIENALRQQKLFWKRTGMIVVLALVLLTAVLIENLLKARESAKSQKSMAALRDVRTAAMVYQENTNEYPRVATVSELSRVLAPVLGTPLPLTDGWGHTLVYHARNCESGRCQSYVVASPGRDGKLDRPLSQYPDLNPSRPLSEQVVYTQSDDNDIVMSNGEFVQCPEPRSGTGGWTFF